MIRFAAARLGGFAAALAGPALAASALAPPGAGFQLRGKTDLFAGGGPARLCVVTFNAATAAVANQGSAGTIAGGASTSSGCAHLTFTGLPWNLTLTGGKGGMIGNMAYDDDGARPGACGPEAVPFTISKSGVWTLNGGQAHCLVQGTFHATPVITITK